METTAAVREACARDVDALIALRSALFESAPADAPWGQPAPTPWQAEYRAQLQAEFRSPERDRQLTVVATLGDEVVGTGTGIMDHRLAGPSVLSGSAGWVQGVFVTDAARGRGLAPRIVSHLEDWFRAHEVEHVYLDTTAMAAAMYERLGYRPTGEPHLVKEL